MIVNSTDISAYGVSYADLGVILNDTTKNKDGIGLDITLTEDETKAFFLEFGPDIQHVLAEIISEAVKTLGTKPSFHCSYDYQKRQFRTCAQ